MHYVLTLRPIRQVLSHVRRYVCRPHRVSPTRLCSVYASIPLLHYRCSIIDVMHII